MSDLADYAWLVDDDDAASALARIAAEPRTSLAWQTSLRGELPATAARLVVLQAELRRRAAAKFGDDAARMFFTPVLLEQATDRAIGAYKAARLRGIAGEHVVYDYCCGVGGDLLPLARSGPCAGWDQSAVACLLAEANVRNVLGPAAAARTAVRQAAVETLAPAADEPWHLDPDRRAGGRRSTSLSDHAPGPDEIARLLRHAPAGAVKLAPATEPPAAWASDAELEWISSRRECRQLVAWFGPLATAPGQRRATVIASDYDNTTAASFTGVSGLPLSVTHEPHKFLYDPDPAILAAGLLGALAAERGLRSLGAGGAYLTGDAHVDDPLLQPFAVEACLPLRLPAVQTLLAAHSIGAVEIKQRGVRVEVEKFRRELRLRGDGAATLFLTRIEQRQVAIIARREPPASE